MDLATALDYFHRNQFVSFWNPRDITEKNLRTSLPDVEALVIDPPNITSVEVHEGQYLVEDGRVEPYQAYQGHEGIDKIFEAVKGAGPGFDQMATAAIKQCIDMEWQITEAKYGSDKTFFRRYVPSCDGHASTLFPRTQSGSYVPCRRWPPTSK
jgi:hypothetical protein